jgi:exopolysaccharide production protein ExoQ
VLLVGVLVMLALASRLGRGGRLFALAAAALMVIPTIVALPEIERQAAILQTDVLKKDARLTGRTLLWEEADRLIAQSPVIGHGYKAIWLGPEGKGLLARNNQKDGRAFHFHDTFRELLADLGMIGLALFLLPLAYTAVRLVVLLVAAIDAPRAFAAASLFTILLRIRTELVIAPFMLDTALLMAIVTALAITPLALNTRSSAHPARPLPPRGRRAHRSLSHPQRNPA